MATGKTAGTISTVQAKKLRSILGAPVPRDYLRLLRELPMKIRLWAEKQGPDAESPLFRLAATVIEENELARAEDIWTEDGPWPRGHLMIGADIGGDKFALCVTENPPAVYRLVHATAELERIGTLRTYLSAVRRLATGQTETITEALDRGRRRKNKQPAWAIKRQAMASGASAQEQQARRSGVDTDWGDAALGYEAASDFISALRCCDEWIALAPGQPFPLGKKADYLHQLVRAETGSSAHRAIRGQYTARYADLASLHAAHVEAVEAMLAATPTPQRDAERWKLKYAKELAQSS